MSFRLLSVEAHAPSADSSNAQPLLGARTTPSLRLSDPSGQDGTRSVSILIGNNGTGKSRLMGDIARAFNFIERATEASKDFPLRRLAYELSNVVYELEVIDNVLKTFVDGNPVPLSSVTVPHTIALTLTPFDKFPLPARHLSLNKQLPLSKYAYFGLRDHTNRASITALLYRSVESLAEASRSSVQRRKQVSGVFEFLGYGGRVRLLYSFRSTIQRIKEIIESDTEERASSSLFLHRRIWDAIHSQRTSQAELRQAIDSVIKHKSGHRQVALLLDFSNEDDNVEIFAAVQVLRSVGIISLQSLEIERLDGTRFNLKDASSGELSIVTGFLALATTLEDESLVLIDEPEISLHPAWQNRYIDLLLATFESYTGCHYIIATHSPLILSDSSIVASTVTYLDSEPGMEASSLAGQSPDFLLVNAFRVPGRNNYYLKQELVSLLRLVADGKVRTEEYISKLALLTPLLSHLESDDPVKDVISQLVGLSAVGEEA